MRQFLFALAVFGSAFQCATAQDIVAAPQTVSVTKIWDAAQHNAFVDLIRWQDQWWCTFREAEGHVKGDGKLRVITSKDGATWESAALLAEEGVDLRDSKLSITPDNRLMIVSGGSIYRNGEFVTRQSRVAFSKDGRDWTPTQKVLHEREWLWRVTWHEGVAYGVTYNGDRTKESWEQILYKSPDGLQWEAVATLEVPGFAGETTLRFLDSGELMALVRRDNQSKTGYIGTSKAPYTEWTWKEIGYRLGGPNFIQIDNGQLWAGTRYYSSPSRTALATMTQDSLTPVLELPSASDSSYPGMVMHEGLLWYAYYSSHESHTSIYLAKIALPEDGKPRAPRYANPKETEYLRTWLLCGPFSAGAPADKDVETHHFTEFDTDWLKESGGEAKAQPKPGDTVTLGDDKRTWLVYTSDKDAIDLDLAISTQDPAAGYAYTEIESAQQQSCLLSLGSNDGIRVWLNGKMIHDYAYPRGWQADTDVVPVVLEQGVNRLLLKIEERGDKWAFSCRVLPASQQWLKEKLSLFQIVPRKDAPPVLHLSHDAEMLREFLQRVELSVTTPEGEKVLWKGAWNGQDQMELPLPGQPGGYLNLHLRLVMNDGSAVDQDHLFLAAEPVPHALFSEGKSDYQIVLSPEASESEKWVAQELQQSVQAIGGVTLPIVTGEATSPQALLVGYQPQVAALLGADAQAPAETDEHFTYRSFGPTIALWGGRERGTMYGVLSFLERELGCRWYTPAVTVTPKRSAFSFTYLDHSEKPLIPVRNDFYYEAFNPVWAAHNRVNGAMGAREQIGGVEAYWGVHTFFPLVPPEEFFATHPEYYSLINGKRVYERAQLCVTNPEVLDILVERLKKIMREQPNNLIYDVSQNDWHNPCQCENCQAIALAEESEAGPVLWFVNQVADRIKGEFPDKYIGTLAYQYTRKPPKNIRPNSNVVIRLCSIECCFAHDFHSCPENQSFLDDINGWSAIAPKMYIWDYVVNFSHYLMPYPNFPVLASNLKTFAEHNALGVMEQAAYQSRGGEFAELRMYLLSKLLWDYTQDVDPIIDDFMYGYYGRGGQYVRAYFDLLHGLVTPDTHQYFNKYLPEEVFTPAFIAKAQALFAQAEQVADNDEVLKRIELAQLPVLYLKCRKMPMEARHDGSYDKFKRVSDRENVLNYSEGGAPFREAFHAQMESLP